MKIAYLGPQGTFSEQAALAYAAGTTEAELVPYETIEDAVNGTSLGEADVAVVPVENSLEGAVTVTMDLLASGCELKIHQEISIPVYQHLMAQEGTTIDRVKTVYSHPQGIAQCRLFLRHQMPQAAIEVVSSTATGARKAKEFRDGAAIGTERAAQVYGLQIIRYQIHDYPNNRTRFFVLAAQQHIPEAADKTSLLLSIENRPGCLYQLLGEFAQRGVDLCKIESRPSKRQLGEYIFFVDLKGNVNHEAVQEAIHALIVSGAWVKFLGSYSIRSLNG